MFLSALVALCLATTASSAVVELPARAASLASPAPVLSFGPSAGPTLAGLLPLLPAAAAPRLPPAPVPFSAAPLDLSRGAGVYERRGVGLLVLDAKDSTALHLSEGSRRAHAMIRGAIDEAESAASSFDGVVIRRLGDGSLIAFPSYAAALGAAEAIQRGNAARREGGVPGPELRVGVNAGRVLVDATGPAPEIYGRPVEKALALAASAGGGGIALEKRAKGEPSPATRAPEAARPVDVLRVDHAATMFAGLEGFSPVYLRHGRRRSYSAVKTFHAYVRAAIERYGGFVVKTEGETVMASFLTAEAAVKAAADIQGRLADLRAAAPLGHLFRSRVGVSWGRVIREERAGEIDFFGNTVNAAARLMRLAGDGEAMISGTAAAEPGVDALLSGGEKENARLKGFGDKVPVVRIKPKAQPRDAKAQAFLRAVAYRARARIVTPK